MHFWHCIDMMQNCSQRQVGSNESWATYLISSDELSLDLQYVIILPLLRSWWGYICFTMSVRLTVCAQNNVRSVSSIILAWSILYQHILSNKVRRCSRVEFWKNYNICIFGNFLQIVTLTLSCVHVLWILSRFLISVFIAATFDFPRWYPQIVYLI